MLRLLRRRTCVKFYTSGSPKPPTPTHFPSPPPPSLLQTTDSSLSSSSLSLSPLFPRRKHFPLFLLLSSISAMSLTAAVLYPSNEDKLHAAAEKARDSVRKFTGSMKQTGAAATILWKSLTSVLSSANHEVKKGFELRVAALVADIVAANEGRRKAIVEAGNGAVVDWLLERVAVAKAGRRESYGTQAEAARALACLIADPGVCEKVLGRPHAVPNLLRFIFSFQPKKANRHKHGPSDGADISKGRSMLVASIMDVITSNCDNIDQASFHPSLPSDGDIGDIAAAISVIEEGAMHFDEDPENNDEDDDGDTGIRGIGIKVIGGTTILGMSREENILTLRRLQYDDALENHDDVSKGTPWQKKYVSSKMHHLSKTSVPGLWDDLQREHIAVPFAAWALANWALASDANRSRIHELDGDGHAILTALTAPERTVKWHGSLVARVLLEDQNLPLTDSVPDWCFSLLSTVLESSKNDDTGLARAALSAFILSIERSHDAKKMVMDRGLDQNLPLTDSVPDWFLIQNLPLTDSVPDSVLTDSVPDRVLLEDQNLPLTDSVPDWCFSLLSTVLESSKNDDTGLARAALSAFILSIERSHDAKKMVMDRGLDLMRKTAKVTDKHKNMQDTLARALELLYTSGMHLSLEESQKWSGILLQWIFNKFSSDSTQTSAIRVISCILEDYGPSSIPISQGWLTILLNEMLGSSKLRERKNQILQSNALIASQVAHRLASAVVNLVRNQVQRELDSDDTSSLADFLALDPFAAINKNINKDKLRKFDAAESAICTLKGIKALTELVTEESSCQNKIVDLGVFCLLRRFILADDYEKLAANETYDASRILEPQEHTSTSSSSANNANDSSSIRVPPTAHIRRHAARLLMILSSIPKVRKAIVADQMLCKWLENCSSGMNSCCNDLKIQSYAKATMLNVVCPEITGGSASVTGNEGQINKCPRYGDMLFLINPDLPHWKYSGMNEMGGSGQDSTNFTRSSSESHSMPSESTQHMGKDSSFLDSADCSDNFQTSATPAMDVVFVHGLRGGPFNSWRIAENKFSTTSKAGLVESIDRDAGKQGTCWPREWLATDFPHARLFTVKYKTNLSQWTGASLLLQEVSSMLLQKLIDAGIGDRPVVFVTHSMGGLVVKQMLYEAKLQNTGKFVNNTIGIIFYSCPHFGSKLADMPWRMGLVLRSAPSIGELRSGSPRLMELNEFLRQRYNKGLLKILSFSETQVTPIVEGYGGWAFRMEIVPIESAYPGFGDIVVLDATDHINSCKPVNRSDQSYVKALQFLQKLKETLT